MLVRIVPYVENNYNAVELGPRGTGKSHLVQQLSPYAHLVSGVQGDGGSHVGQQQHGPAWGWSASTTWSASTKSPG
jgi:hypothetical protein